MVDFVVRTVRKNGKRQLFITLTDGECGITSGDYVVVRKLQLKED